MTGFSLRTFNPLISCRSIADMQGSVHWWPGDHKHTRSWTDWDPEGFNSGVAGPFLKYVKETSTLFSLARHLQNG